MTVTESAGVRLTLRPYQEEALARTLAARDRGVSRQMGVAATGLGKTVIFCALAERMGARTLVLAHRDELIEQAAAKVREVWPGARVGVVKAERNEVNAEVVVASVQTLARSSRLARVVASQESALLGARPFGLVVVDEAHHSAAPSYVRVLEALGCGEPAGPLLLGVTATPDRGDGKGLDHLYDEVTWTYDILWGIRSGYLADVKGKRVTLDALNLSDVRVSRGDYDQGQAGAALRDAGAPAAIVKAWTTLAAGRRTLVFTPTVEVADLTRRAFLDAGVNAGMVSGETPLEERRATLRAFSEGRLDVLANCAVLTEGYDEPRVDCVVVARPTRSRALYTQMVGRGTRRHPDKDHLLVLDVVGASAEHSLVTIPSLFGVERPDEWEAAGTPLTAVLDEQEAEAVRLGRLRAEDVELFRQMRSEGMAWVAVHEPGQARWYTISLGGRTRRRVLLRELLGASSWIATAEREVPDEETGKTRTESKVLIADVDLEMAQGVAEDYIRKVGGHGAAALTAADAPWRRRRPSPKAKDAARKWRLPNVDGYPTAGELSDALEAHIARVRARRRRA